MIIDGKITKKLIFNNDHGGNVNFDIKPYNLYDFFTKTAPLKKIPNYQRPYSWKKKNVQDFLNDIAKIGNEPMTFIDLGTGTKGEEVAKRSRTLYKFKWILRNSISN